VKEEDSIFKREEELPGVMGNASIFEKGNDKPDVTIVSGSSSNIFGSDNTQLQPPQNIFAA